jgi:hypothetical protein
MEEDERPFESAREVGDYFKQLLRMSGQTFEDSECGASFQTLRNFLEYLGIYNRASLRHFFERSGLSTNPESAYTEFKREYRPLPVNQVLFLIEEEFLDRNGHNITNPYAPPPPAQRIEIMMGTLFWAEQLYPSLRHNDWKIGFINRPCDFLTEYLNWLGGAGPRDILRGHQLNDQDESILRGFWRWFETHNMGPIKLAFAMASHGIARDSQQERGDLRRIIRELGYLIDYPAPVGHRLRPVA